MIKVVSRIKDKRINAQNVLVEISVGEYIDIAKGILRKNEFQRKRVKGSQTVYSLLKRDMKDGCTFPPIVVAVRSEEMANLLNTDAATDEQIIGLFEANKLIILDGLQRTYTLIDLVNELGAAKDSALESVLQNPIRIEIFLGLNKIGILYRMLTLNTGQTPMSVRHQIEILYSDYHDKEFDGIKIFREIDSKNPQKLGEYKFNEVIEGFNAYLDRDPLPLTRSDVLENIKNLESLSDEDSSDLFRDFLSSYNTMVLKLDNLAPDWEANISEVTDVEADGEGNKLFGKNLLQIFSKPQVLSGFGAAIGKLRQFDKVEGFVEVTGLMSSLTFEKNNPQNALNDLLKKLLSIQLNAKKIGSEQRYFFTYFFRELFNNDSDSYLKIDQAIESGYSKYQSLV